MTHHRAVAWSSWLAAALMLCWMGRSLVTGEIPFTGDLLHWSYPLRDFYARALANGHRVWWWPSIFGGFDVAGEGQLGAFHPLHWLLYRLVPLDRAFAIELVAPYILLYAGAWLFLRRWCGNVASFGALLVTFSGFTVSHGVHMNMVAVVAHLPWLLWSCDAVVAASTRRSRIAPAAGIAALTASQLLLGHPQAVWWSGLLTSAYAAFLLARRPVSGRAPAVLTLVGGALLGAGMGAVQLLATLDHVQHSIRPLNDPTWATTFSLPPGQLLQLLAPYLFWGRVLRWNEAPGAGDEFAVYAGVVPLTLTIWWLASKLDGRRPVSAPSDRLAWWGFGIAVAGMWLATGSYGKLYYLQTWLPVVDGFRAPVRFILFAHLGLALVAVMALTQLQRARPTESRGRAPIIAIWALVLASTLVALWPRGTATGSSIGAHVIIGPLLFALAALLVTLVTRRVPYAVIGLVLLAAGDQALYGLGGVAAWQDFLTRPAAERLLDSRAAGIAADRGRLARGGFPNLYTLSGYRLIDGYAGLAPRRTLDYKTANTLRVAGVGYVNQDFLGTTAIPGATALARDWLELPPPLPRARLVADVRTTTDVRADIERVDVERTAFVSRALSSSPWDRPDLPGRASLVRDEPGDLVVDTDAPAPRLLVVSESFNGGWTVTLDGTPALVEQVNGDFMGVVVPTGAHRAVFTFAPAFFQIGRAVSLMSLAATLTLLILATGRINQGMWGSRR